MLALPFRKIEKVNRNESERDTTQNAQINLFLVAHRKTDRFSIVDISVVFSFAVYSVRCERATVTNEKLHSLYRTEEHIHWVCVCSVFVLFTLFTKKKFGEKIYLKKKIIFSRILRLRPFQPIEKTNRKKHKSTQICFSIEVCAASSESN